jgi:hypothetical protein
MARRLLFVVGFAAAAVLAVGLAGCNSDPGIPATVPPPVEHDGHGGGRGDEDHAHKPGAHGGIIVALGRDSYHVEAVFEKGGVIKLYTLGKDEGRVQDVESQELISFVTAAGSAEAEQVKFVPEPQPGDSPGKTSRFLATLPPSLSGKAVQVTINNLKIGSERFRLGFANENAGHAGAMPSKLGSEKEQRIFFSPAGKYTAADVVANGNTVPSIKFADLDIEHDEHPKAGDRICPISKTKANPKLTWVVGGKTYDFCCTPCVQEFVMKAKEKPAEILEPAAYIKQAGPGKK